MTSIPPSTEPNSKQPHSEELCSTDDFEDKTTKGITLNNQQYVVIQKDSQFYVYKNRCPHIGINLEYQPNRFLNKEEQYIQCTNHGALFEIETGYCIAGPCSGKSLIAVTFQHINHTILVSGE
jgi:nitrite reductase/ring-hydroxylating ferredoxin subunit